MSTVIKPTGDQIGAAPFISRSIGMATCRCVMKWRSTHRRSRSMRPSTTSTCSSGAFQGAKNLNGCPTPNWRQGLSLKIFGWFLVEGIARYPRLLSPHLDCLANMDFLRLHAPLRCYPETLPSLVAICPFTAAATTRLSVSCHVEELEDQLGYILFVRRTCRIAFNAFFFAEG